ncbi:SURF1 family protein [Methylorubrum sp. SB2]|uniref:SURF1 family protein n=1 Tax=Methylorubrum subtropicum TaxID=3138812 RepID=UPI00313C8482
MSRLDVRRAVLALAGLGLVGVFLALGTWQIQRRAWKLDLIARVEARIRAEPVSPPEKADWAHLDGPAIEYRRVRVSGILKHDRTALVQALTERGSGFWVLTPLVQSEGTTVLINRGFVPGDRKDRSDRTEPVGDVTITGLLRLPEPGGGFLRHNDPAADRWYSRDVSGLAAARNLHDVAPYFIDADATPNPGGLPVGGLTVVAFRNDHLVYALTWFTLALMSAGALIYALKRPRAEI